MKELSETLLAAQKEASRTPYVTLTARNKIAGVTRLRYERLYSGNETDGGHALAVPADGSLIRLRVTPPDDNRRLLRQRVLSPGPASDFSEWEDTGHYDVLACTSCTLGNAVSIIWIEGNRRIYHQQSTDNGASWGTPEVAGFTATSVPSGIAAVYKESGDIAVFVTDMDNLFVIKKIGGEWQNAVNWDKETGLLSGVSVYYDGDWNLLATGRDASGNYKLWSFVYGDGGNIPAGTWSDLREMASATAAGDYEYINPSIVNADAVRCFFVEKYNGVIPYRRPFSSHLIPENSFVENLWTEPIPFNLESECGLAMAYRDDYLWLSSPSGVFRADVNEEILDLRGDTLAFKVDLTANSSKLTVELNNASGIYSLPGQGELSVLTPGCELELGLGYRTTGGDETGMTIIFRLDAFEHISAAGKGSLVLHASGGWERLADWRAHHQFRWNKADDEASVKDIIVFVLSRAGIGLEAISESATATGFYPDFTIHPGESGEATIGKLASFIPDIVFIQGDRAYLLNPQPTDSAVYAYGDGHRIIEGRYLTGLPGLSCVRVEGVGPASSDPIIAESFDWNEIERDNERMLIVRDANIGTIEDAEARGEALLRKSSIDSTRGFIRIPVNCGQELYDVIEVNDERAGLTEAKRRVIGITALYDTRKGVYESRLSLGAV